MTRWNTEDLRAYLERRKNKTAQDIYEEVTKEATKGKSPKKPSGRKTSGSTNVITRNRAAPKRDSDGSLYLELPVELHNGNDGQTKHWGKTVKYKKAYAVALKSCYTKPLETPEYRQDIIITRVLKKGQRLWDADSVLRGSAKQLIDALVDYGFMQDDGPKWIRTVVGKQDDNRRDVGPAVTIEFVPVKE